MVVINLKNHQTKVDSIYPFSHTMLAKFSFLHSEHLRLDLRQLDEPHRKHCSALGNPCLHEH